MDVLKGLYGYVKCRPRFSVVIYNFYITWSLNTSLSYFTHFNENLGRMLLLNSIFLWNKMWKCMMDEIMMSNLCFMYFTLIQTNRLHKIIMNVANVFDFSINCFYFILLCLSNTQTCLHHNYKLMNTFLHNAFSCYKKY